MKYPLAIAALIPNLAVADTFAVNIASMCSSNVVEIIANSVQYQQEPLFTGLTFDYDQNKNAVPGRLVFTVNQDTGTYSIFTFYENGWVCLHREGFLFEPYTN